MDNLYKEKYKQAPEKIKEIVLSPDINEILSEIENTYDIAEEKRGHEFIDKEVDGVLLGIKHPKDFVVGLENTLGVSEEDARKIAKEVNEKIFSPVKDYLIELHKIGGDKTETQHNTQENMANEDTHPDIPPKALVFNTENFTPKEITHQNTNTGAPVSVSPPVPPAPLPPLPPTPPENTQEELQRENIPIAPPVDTTPHTPVAPLIAQNTNDNSAPQNPFETKLEQASVLSSNLPAPPSKIENQTPTSAPNTTQENTNNIETTQQKDRYREPIE